MDSIPSEYFQTEYRVDERKLDEIEQLLEKVWHSLVACRTASGWPYDLVEGEQVVPPTSPSLSTQTMVLFGLCTQLGLVSLRTIAPASSSSVQRSPVQSTGSEELHKTLTSVVDERLKLLASVEEGQLDSSSFGVKNPFTLAWLTAVIGGAFRNVDDFKHSVAELQAKNFGAKLGEWVEIATCRIKSLKELQPKLLDIPAGKGKAAIHAFPALRAIHLFNMVKEICSEGTRIDQLEEHQSFRQAATLSSDEIRAAGVWFRSRLLDHLALASIRDAPFDAAELAFSLEGFLYCEAARFNAKNHDPDLIRKVFEVLHDRQEINPYWRPLKPILTNDRGFALLPLSVEIVNSLFRTCWLLEHSGEEYFSQYIDVFKRYYEWIVSRSTHGEFKAENGEISSFTGWHSEHVQQPGSIHIWETSQVAVYLLHYREMLQSHIARRALSAARLTSRALKRKEKHAALPIVDYWETQVSKKDPQPPERQLYNDIAKLLVQCRSPGAKGRHGFSMVLYGPPGTGKTSIAEDLAATLGWKFCEITPSDFVASGESEVELRAREIFTALSEQGDTVILFDEIDRLILDRDSALYLEQGDMFQVMTPGMLPKLKLLRSRQRSIFILATNYWERLDPAAIRIGRIDKQLLVSLPNSDARSKILANELKDELGKLDAVVLASVPAGEAMPPSHEITPDDLVSVANACALGAYGELCELIRNAAARVKVQEHVGHRFVLKTEIVDALENELKTFASTVTIGSYRSRFKIYTSCGNAEKAHSTNKQPFVEFIDLAGLLCENDKTREHLTTSVCQMISDVLRNACDTYDVAIDGVARDAPAGLAQLVDRLADHAAFQTVRGALKLTSEAMKDSTKWKT
ncbi:MAG: AAA family ATPase [Pirellulaceae bacterium]|nr:AAA family ATPase [Pirellulaceae bacterium]